jgi:hypothetical protein
MTAHESIHSVLIHSTIGRENSAHAKLGRGANGARNTR